MNLYGREHNSKMAARISDKLATSNFFLKSNGTLTQMLLYEHDNKIRARIDFCQQKPRDRFQISSEEENPNLPEKAVLRKKSLEAENLKKINHLRWEVS